MLNNSFNQIDIQKKALDASWLRQSILANNIANVNTPGYKRQDVEFESFLQDYLNQSRLNMYTTNPNHFTNSSSQMSLLQPTITTNQSTSYRLDGNNVNIDVEMAAVAQNSVKYNAVTTQLNAQIRRLKSAIRGGQ